MERSKKVSGEMHAIAKEFSMAGVLIHSKTKAGELAGSIRVQYDADVVWDMSRPDENKPEIYLRCNKFREGENNRIIQLIKVPGFPAFALKARQEQGNLYGRQYDDFTR